eukprot:9493052-Pyramimonas_sp.AAC.1
MHCVLRVARAPCAWHGAFEMTTAARLAVAFLRGAVKYLTRTQDDEQLFPHCLVRGVVFWFSAQR